MVKIITLSPAVMWLLTTSNQFKFLIDLKVLILSFGINTCCSYIYNIYNYKSYIYDFKLQLKFT